MRLIAPLPDDVEALRRVLLASAPPTGVQVDAVEARRVHLEGNLAIRAAWQPPVDGLPVEAIEIPAQGGLPPMRRYVPLAGVGAGAPTLLWFHGGGWVLGSIATADATSRVACARTGWEVVSVEYRCAPEAPFPAAAEDALTSTEWLLGQRERVVVAGDSSGANLAGVAARRLAGHPALVGQVLVYPATDPTLASASAHEFVEGPFLSQGTMEWFYGQYLGPVDGRADPLIDLSQPDPYALGPAVPAVLFTVGHDPLRDECIDYVRLLREQGASVTWIHAPELHHGAFNQSGVLPSAAARVDEAWAAAVSAFS